MKYEVWYAPKINSLVCHYADKKGMSIAAHAIDSLKIPFLKLRKIGPKKMGWIRIGEL